MQVRIGGAHLDGDGRAVGRELVVGHIEPVVGSGGWTRVGKAEDDEGGLQTVFTAKSLNMMPAGLEFPRCHRLRLIGSTGLPASAIYTVFHLAFYRLASHVTTTESNGLQFIVTNLLGQVADQCRGFVAQG